MRRWRDALRAAGVDVVIGADLRRAERRDDGSVAVTYALDGDERTVEADELLAATGRKPATDDVGLESVGLEPGRPLAVDRQTLVEGVDGDWLYATGDVTGEVGTTHQGKYQGRVAGDVIAARFGSGDTDGAPTDGEPVPSPGVEPTPWTRYATTADHAAVDAGRVHRAAGRLGGAAPSRPLAMPGSTSGWWPTSWPNVAGATVAASTTAAGPRSSSTRRGT